MKRNNIKNIGFYCQLLLVCVLASCSKSNNNYFNTFRYNQIGGLASLDPAFAKNLSIMWGTHFIYNTLVEVDSSLNLQPSLATHWTVSADGLQYTFTIRQGVLFQDNPVFKNGKGRQLTAQDIVYSYNRIIDPATASPGAWIFNDRVRKNTPFEAPNDSTFVLHLKAPFRPLLQILSMPYCGIVPKEVVEHWGRDFRSHPCGTGPFQLQFWDEGNTLILHRNPHYWELDSTGNRLPYLEAVQVYFNETRAMEYLLFEQGKLDFINGIDGSMKDLILTKKGTLQPNLIGKFKFKKQTYLNTEYIGILIDTNNSLVKHSALKLQLVRQAINYAIDKQKIITYFRNGIGIPATKGFTPIAMPGANNQLKYGYTYNPTKALQLLAEAGYPNAKGLPPISILTPESSADICNLVADELSDIGIKASVNITQPALLRQMMSNNKAPVFKAQWIADYPDAETYLAYFYSQYPSPPNYTRFSNIQYDTWYTQAMQTNNDSLRLWLYAQMDSLASSYASVIPLFYDELVHFTQNNISGLQSNALNMIDLKRVKKQ